MEVKIIVPDFPNGIAIGEERENLAVPVVVDYTAWIEQHGAGALQILLQRPQDADPYPVTVTNDNGEAVWTPNETDMNFKGRGEIQLVFTAGEVIERSPVIMVISGRSLVAAGDPPEPYEDWLERLTELGAETQANAQAAQQSAEDAEQSAQEAAQEVANAEGYAEQAGESASAAQSAEAASESARDEAQTAQTASEAARDAAQTAQASAESSATAASGSAASAAGSATAAAGSASDASASASAAGASASAASASATTASNAATAAQTAQSAAEDAAEDAQQAAQQAHVEYEQLSGEVDDLSDEVSQQKSAIEDLQDLTNRKAGMLVDTASGAIASFTPDSTIDNLLGVTVDVEPVQDLHGYDSPWPAGGGKNKFDATIAYSEIANGDGTYTATNSGSGMALTRVSLASYVGQTVTFSFTATEKTGETNVWYIRGTVNGVGNASTVTNRILETDTLPKRIYQTITPETADDRVEISYGSGSGTITFKDIQLEVSSSMTDFAPYSNICPISGRESADVEATGINIWDEEWEVGGISTSTGGNIAQTDRIRSKNYIPLKPGATFNLHNGSGKNIKAYYYDSNKAYVTSTSFGNAANLSIVPNYPYMRIIVSATTQYGNNISINYPATDHAYHPYAGNTYTIALGETVYGATLTIAEDGSVTALVDRVSADLGTLNWITGTAGGHNFFRVSLTPVPKAAATDALFSNGYKAVSTGVWNSAFPDKSAFLGTTNWGSTPQLAIRDDGYADVASFAAAMQGMQLVYRLATPIEITLDPVTISTISGQTNNVWADAGDVSVEFAADVKTYIDNKIAAAVAALS